MKRPPQIAEELEEKEVDKLLFLEVLFFKFSNFTTHLVIFLWLLIFFVVTFCLQERGGGWTRLYIVFVELMFYSGGAWGQTDADILAWKFLVMTHPWVLMSPEDMHYLNNYICI